MTKLLTTALALAAALVATTPAASQPRERIDPFAYEADDVVGVYLSADKRWKPIELRRVALRFASENSLRASAFRETDTKGLWIIEFEGPQRRSKVKPLVEQLRLLRGIKLVELNLLLVIPETGSRPAREPKRPPLRPEA